VGGVRQTLWNTNFFALSQDIGISNFFLVGDSTWPGLGTVACIAGSRIAAEAVLGSKARVQSTAQRKAQEGALAQDCAVLRSQAFENQIIRYLFAHTNALYCSSAEMRKVFEN
jgi:hypothetical protein